MLILVTGGSRSGKSRFALELAQGRAGPHAFVATAQAVDEEMAARIEAHRRARPSGWTLIEEPRDAVGAVARALGPARTVIFDCVTVWVSNLLLADEGFDERRAGELAQQLVAVAGRGAPGVAVIVVTNEVGSGVVPDNALARRFRDCAGRANEVIARGADEVYLLVSGIPLRIKPRADTAPAGRERNELHG